MPLGKATAAAREKREAKRALAQQHLPKPSRRRAQSWVIQEHQNGAWSVEHGNRPYMGGMSSRQEALQVLASAHQLGERVFVAEPDGYRTEITSQLARSKILHAQPRRRPHYR